MSTPTSWPIARLSSSDRDRAIARANSAATRSGQRPMTAAKRRSRTASARGLEHVPARAGDERLGVVGLPRVQQVAGPEQLGRRPVDHPDVADEEPVEDEQAEVPGARRRRRRRLPLARLEPHSAWANV